MSGDKKLVNIALIIGTGYAGEDVLHKTPWVKYLNNEHKVFVASRINPLIHFKKSSESLLGSSNCNTVKDSLNELIKVSEDFTVIYDSNYFKKNYTIEEIDELQGWLGISFSYIASLDRRFYNISKSIDIRNKNDLNNFLASLVSFFKEFFYGNQIKFFINTIEDDAISMMAYFVAKRMKLKILGFMGGRFPRNGLMFCYDFTELCEFNNTESDFNFDKIKSLYDKRSIAGKETLIINEKNFAYSSLPRKFKTISYINKYEEFRKHSINNYKSENFIIETNNPFKALNKFFKEFIRRYLIKSILEIPNYNESFFLFSLHYMNDAQITFREPSLDQFKLIRDIARALPVNSYLYVKPHPHYFGSDVSFRELRKLSKINNIKIINPMHSPIELINNSKGVLTVNSTTGFEALIMGIPLITFGHDFYCKENLCYIIRDINELSEALMNILNNQYKIERSAVEKFVENVYNNTIWIEGKEYVDDKWSDKFIPFALTEEDGKMIALALNIILNH